MGYKTKGVWSGEAPSGEGWFSAPVKTSFMPTWPGLNYLGPGNPLPNGKPVNKADAIACNHDWAYEFAQSRGDIRRADKVAIKEFGAHALQGSHHALVRALGIGAKYLAEGVIGVQYPSGLPRQAEAMRTGNIKQLAEYHGNCENQRRESEKRNA
ncbi:hypothetical protein GE061_011680 [Apolygus lucorum]|uniref:Phospholipase A2-like domain-containing protein n=1 Tax=Apolygus lucorum TaxID=248454 RepID=A0A8S9XXZ8_APOLU|nr:hypothetical protein GE061_011680 [Apolygus lucorum]